MVFRYISPSDLPEESFFNGRSFDDNNLKDGGLVYNNKFDTGHLSIPKEFPYITFLSFIIWLPIGIWFSNPKPNPTSNLQSTEFCFQPTKKNGNHNFAVYKKTRCFLFIVRHFQSQCVVLTGDECDIHWERIDLAFFESLRLSRPSTCIL